MTELFVPCVGLVWFGGALSGEELEQVLADLCQLPPAERLEYFDAFDLQDADSGAMLRVMQFSAAPLSGVEQALLFANVVRSFRADVALRVKWARMFGAPFVSSPNLDTACGVCLSCGDALQADVLFGRCDACARAFRVLTMEADVMLPDRQHQ